MLQATMTQVCGANPSLPMEMVISVLLEAQTILVTSIMKIELPLGDIVDRYSILSIKSERIQHEQALQNVFRELQSIQEAWNRSDYPSMDALPEWNDLLKTNQMLWDVEDALRNMEQKKNFNADFIELARNVYQLNDQRAQLKRSINLSLGSILMEEKSYPTVD